MQQLQKPKILSPAELQRKSEELDAREEYLVKREALHQGLERDIQAHLRELVSIDHKIESQNKIIADNEQRIKNHEKHIDSLQKVYAEKAEEYKERLKALRQKADSLSDELKLTRDQIKQAQDSIDERKKYLDEQEKHIAEAIEAGNLELRTLTYEITEGTHSAKDLKQEIRTLREDQSVTENDIQGIRDAFMQEEQDAKDRISALVVRAEELSHNVETTEKLIATNKLEAAKVLAEVDEKMKTLGVREQEILVKRNALKEESIEMDEKRRRFSSAESLYNV